MLAHLMSMLGDYEKTKVFIQLSMRYQKSGMPAKLRFTAALAEFGLGNFEEAWRLYESRFDYESGATWKDYASKNWRGENLEGKSILVWTDQGLGDSIRNATLLPELAQAADHVVLEVSRGFVDYFSQSFPNITCREFTCSIGKNTAGPKRKETDCDFDCNISELARYLRPTIDSFNKVQGSVFQFNKELSKEIRSRIKNPEGKPIVGLCWRSTKIDQKRMRSYMLAQDYIDIVNSEDAIYINLQNKWVQHEVDTILASAKHQFITFEDIDVFNDLNSAAALIAACDIVITPATNIGDMAGVLDVPAIRYTGPNSMYDFGTGYVPWSRSIELLYIDDRQTANYMVPEIIKRMKAYLGRTFPQKRLERLGI